MSQLHKDEVSLTWNRWVALSLCNEHCQYKCS